MYKNSDMNKIFGWEVPKGTIPCWVVENEQRLKALRESKPFPVHAPQCFFSLNKRLDNNFIEGYLWHSSEGKFHEFIGSPNYFTNFQKRIPVYFSFDRVTLYRLVEIMPSKPLTFILRRIDNPQRIVRNKAFMIMPFGITDLDKFYVENVKLFLNHELGIDIYRSDDFNGNDIIIETIYNQIEESEFIIADTSESNKNVFYEFGWAASKNKEIITIQNEKVEKQLFFDRAHIRAILYSQDKIKAFQERLKNDIIAIRQKIDSET